MMEKNRKEETMEKLVFKQEYINQVRKLASVREVCR
jgi:hypothetical protein